jgi:hypothetical protein
VYVSFFVICFMYIHSSSLCQLSDSHLGVKLLKTAQNTETKVTVLTFGHNTSFISCRMDVADHSFGWGVWPVLSVASSRQDTLVDRARVRSTGWCRWGGPFATYSSMFQTRASLKSWVSFAPQDDNRMKLFGIVRSINGRISFFVQFQVQLPLE